MGIRFSTNASVHNNLTSMKHPAAAVLAMLVMLRIVTTKMKMKMKMKMKPTTTFEMIRWKIVVSNQ